MTIKRGADKVTIQQAMQKLYQHHKSKVKQIDIYKYCGILKLDKDPVEIQKQLRDEWK